MEPEKIEIPSLADYLASRGGVADTFPQAGAPMPGEQSPSLMAQRCLDDGAKFPAAGNDHNIGTLVAKAPNMRLGG